MPTASGRIVKSRKGKTTTPHKNTHRWESFSSKISKLHSLDPIRRVRRHDLEIEDLKSTTSYFRNGLEKWTDLNISKPFTSFRREVLPISDSLAQILHFENKIMDALATYISAQEKEALEPLLDLLTAFAHDLGARFEKHYARALALLIETASHRHDADVIEWTFASLAFLFKYLSRLLAPDVCPTYDSMAPLLGKAKNPPHIARFAAEALSFLVSKAAAPSNRETSLPALIQRAKRDLEDIKEDRQHELYYHGVMTMFAEAIKTQGNGVHTSGPAIIRALISSTSDQDICSNEPNSWPELVCGVFVSIIHHTNASTFEAVARTVYEERSLDKLCVQQPLRNIVYVKLLGIMAGVRKGSRITDWQLLLDCLIDSLQSLSQDPECLKTAEVPVIWQQILVNIAIVWHSAPMERLLPLISNFMGLMTRDPLMRWFIPFCSYSSELDAVKFRSLFMSHFQKYGHCPFILQK
jgi:U3 small nucleolar RNA-associated protein 20